MNRMLPILLGLVVLALPLTAAETGGDPLRPYLDGQAPEILRDLPPPAEGVPATITLRRVVFRSRNQSEIFAVIATPKTAGPHPGMLVLHGGGGSAEVAKAMAWAQRGYVAVAPDLPGIAEPKKLIDTKGPFTALKYGTGRWTASPDASASVIFDAVLSGMKSLYLLRAQPSVDPQHIGVVGISWGGYMTTMVCGLAGDQVRAGFAIFGCGYYDLTSTWSNMRKLPEAEQAAWLACLDPGRRAPGMKAAYFLVGATNDFFYWPQAVQATLDAVPGARNQLYVPNANHKVPLPGGMDFPKDSGEPFKPTPDQQLPTPTGSTANWMAMEVPYFEYHLKGRGEPLPVVTNEPGTDPRQLTVRVTAPRPVTGVTVHWAPAHPEVKTRVWTSLPTTATADGRYHATLPPEAVEWFALTSDDRPVSVSSSLIQVAK